MSVQVLKLVSGEEILGDVLEQLDNTVTINNVVAIVLQRTQTGDMGIGFMPFMPYVASKKLKIDQSKIILMTDVDEEVKNQYNSIFGGIVTPSSKLILG